jgi:hypothetical protein
MGHVGRAAEPVEWFIGEVVIARLSRPDAADLLKADDRPDAAEADMALTALRTRRKSVLALVADGTFTEAEARQQVAALDAEIREAEGRLVDSGRADILGPLVNAKDVRAAWEAMDTDRQRAVISVLMTVRLLPPGRGVRLGQTPEAWEANADRLDESLDIRWHGES